MAYIYEYIRTQGHEPMHFEEHYVRLDALSVIYFAESLRISRQELVAAIKEHLQNGHFSHTAMNVVCVKYFTDGTVELEADYMIYSEFSMRALHPQAHLLRVSGKQLIDNTSAKAAFIDFSRTCLQQSNGGSNDVAIWADEKDEVLAIDGSPVIAIFEDEIRFSKRSNSVELDLAYEAVSTMNRNVTRGMIEVADLTKVKELLYIGHEGLSAVRIYKPNPILNYAVAYMDISAEKIAAMIAKMERK